MPTVDALRALIPEKSRKDAIVFRDAREARLLTYALGEENAKGFGLLGARTIGKTLFLCASPRVVNAIELQTAADACAGLSLTRR